jgi:group I intron endonuclease
VYEIYVVTNKTNGKQYVGQTCKGFEKRWIKHLDCARRGLGHKFPNALRKYGKDGFTHEIVATAETVEWSNYLERMWILLLDSVRKGYNTTEGGEGFRGDLNPNRLNPRRGKDNPNFGKVLPPETRERISKSLMGRFPGEKNPFFGKSHTPEMVQFFSESQKGKKTHPPSDETREKIRQSMLGRTFAPETLEKMRNAKLGGSPSDSHRASLSKAQIERREREWSEKYNIVEEDGLFTVRHRETGIVTSHKDRQKAFAAIARKIKRLAKHPESADRWSPEHIAHLSEAQSRRWERTREEQAA